MIRVSKLLFSFFFFRTFGIGVESELQAYATVTAR